MKQNWDDIDRMIVQSEEEIIINSNYNSRLMDKLRKENKERQQSYIGAFSLIMAGFLVLFIYTSDLQYKIEDIQTRARVEIIDMQYNYDGYGFLKYLWGE